MIGREANPVEAAQRRAGHTGGDDGDDRTHRDDRDDRDDRFDRGDRDVRTGDVSGGSPGGDGYDATVPVWVVRGLLHDQLNALTVLSARLSVVRNGLTSQRVTTDEVKQAEENARWIERLTRETLRSLAGSGRTDGEERCEVGRVVENSIRRWASGMPALEVEAQHPRDTWAPLPATALERILQNLLLNAGGFAESRVLVRSRCEDDEVVIAVEDDGPGFVTEAFPPLGVTARSTGFGLGLSVVRWVAERWGGRADIGSSDELGGARVTVTMPRAEPPPARSEKTPSLESLEGIRVALVDDSQEVLRAMGSLLERLEARVDTIRAHPSSTIRELADEVREAEPQVVLIDVHLGVLSGLDLLEELREDGIDPSCLLLMSGTGETSVGTHEVDQIPKPPDWPVLIRLIRERAAD